MSNVLIRADFSVPLDGAGAILDGTRIDRAVKLADALATADHGVRVIAHAGQPRRPEHRYSFERLLAAAGRPDLAQATVPADEMGAFPGSGVVQVVQNLRFWSGEWAGDRDFGAALARDADRYVLSEISMVHRQHASIIHTPRFIAEHELAPQARADCERLDAIRATANRIGLCLIVGGNKIESKCAAGRRLLPAVKLLVLGGMPGDLLADDASEPPPAAISELADTATAQGIPWIVWPRQPDSAAAVSAAVQDGMAVVWAGPLGRYEAGDRLADTLRLCEIAHRAEKFLAAGGDTGASLLAAGIDRQIIEQRWVSGGGAALAYLADGWSVPGLTHLRASGRRTDDQAGTLPRPVHTGQ